MIYHMKRTTLILDERAFRELKKLSAAEGRTLSDLVNQVIQMGLATYKKPPQKSRTTLPKFSMGAPMVDLADRDQLYARMDEHQVLG